MRFGLKQRFGFSTTHNGGTTPTFTVNPTISGTAVVGQPLSVSFTLNNADTVTRKWYRNGVLIFTSTTSNDYVLVQADAGQNIKCNVEGSNGAGSVNADSNTLAILATLLDLYPSAAAAYSVRLLRGAQLNNAVCRIRRSGDNAEVDVFVDSNYQLSLSSNITSRTSGTTLSSWVGVQDGFVVTWYNQANASNNATQSTATNQPKLISGGALILINSKTSLLFDGSNDHLPNSAGTSVPTNVTAFGVRSIPSFPNTFRTLFNWKTYGFSFMSAQLTYRQVHIVRNGTTVRAENYPLTTGQALDYMFNQANLERNSINQTLQAGYTYGAGVSSVGSWSGTSQCFPGNIQEILIYESNESANKSGIQNNINSFYGIY